MAESDSTVLRSCTKCGEPKPLTEFGHAKLGKYGKSSRCKLCVNKHSADYRKLPGVVERYKEINKARYLRNKPKIMAQQLVRHHKNKNRPDKKVAASVRAGISAALRGARKSGRTFDLLGYTKEELAAHIQRQFLPGMSWSNSGKWHIDHIIPVSSFLKDFGANEVAIVRAWALTNLRPIWAKENLQKQDKRTHLI